MILEFKITLRGSQPAVWRQVKISDSATFHEFHVVIQSAFGWENSHLHQFSEKGWGSRPIIAEKLEDNFDDDEFLDIKHWPRGKNFDNRSICLKDYFHSGQKKMVYIYDFGDSWEHSIALTAIREGNLLIPLCTGGGGKCPPEDCGGLWGYYDMAETANSARHPEHNDVRDWLGLKKGQIWDLNEFDLEETNKRIREYWEERWEM